MKTVTEFLEELMADSAFMLASYAGCGTPDTVESPGATYLISIRNAVALAIRDAEIVPEGQCATEDRSDVISRIANDAALIYTYDKWLAFTDLCAYQRAEDVAGDYGDPSDMDAWADTCLYSIAEELCTCVCQDFDEHCTPDEEDDASE